MFVFRPTADEIHHKQLNVRYSAAANKYERFLTSTDKPQILQTYSDWSACVHQHHQVLRKVEPDWRMAYLARQPESEAASMSWKFDFTAASGLRIATVALKCATKTYESGGVDVEFYDDGDKRVESLDVLRGRSGFRVRCRLHGGSGDNAWQHAQLFRQASNAADEFPFEVNVVFM